MRRKIFIVNTRTRRRWSPEFIAPKFYKRTFGDYKSDFLLILRMLPCLPQDVPAYSFPLLWRFWSLPPKDFSLMRIDCKNTRFRIIFHTGWPTQALTHELVIHYFNQTPEGSEMTESTKDWMTWRWNVISSPVISFFQCGTTAGCYQGCSCGSFSK